MHITSDDTVHLLGKGKEAFRKFVRLHTDYFSKHHDQGIFSIILGVTYTALAIYSYGWIAIFTLPLMMLLGIYSTFVFIGIVFAIAGIIIAPFALVFLAVNAVFSWLKKWAEAEPKSKKKN